MIVFLHGFTLRLAYVAPTGVQNLFVINAASSDPFARAVAVSLVVAFFDVLLAISCFYGVGEIMRLFGWLRPAILLCGGALLVFIGAKLLRSLPGKPCGGAQPSAKGAAATAFAVTWLNPQALIDGTMMLGAFRSTLAPSAWVPFMAGVCAASLAWFPGLAVGVGMFRNRLGSRFFRWVNIVCGCVIICYGLKLLCDFVRNILGAGQGERGSRC